MEKERNYSLDFLKIIATIFIVFHHYQQCTRARFTYGINFWDGNFYWGYMVELFFIISGVLMFKYIDKIKNNKISFKEFTVKRFARLIPMLIFGAIMYEIILILYVKLYNQKWFDSVPSIWGTIIDSLGIQNGGVFKDQIVNFPTWYCSVLLLMYVVFYISVKFASKKNISPYYIFVGLIMLGCAIRTYEINLPFLTRNTARGFYAFFTGLILAKFLNNNKEITKKQIIISSVIVYLYLLCWFTYRDLLTEGIEYILTFILYPSIIILFNSRALKKIFSFKGIKKLSEISFSVYIIHASLIVLMFVGLKILNKTIYFNDPIYMIVFTIICWLTGTLVHYLYEKPMKKVIDKKERQMFKINN